MLSPTLPGASRLFMQTVAVAEIHDVVEQRRSRNDTKGEESLLPKCSPEIEKKAPPVLGALGPRAFEITGAEQMLIKLPIQ